MANKYSRRRKQILKQLRKFDTDKERLAAYAGFMLGEWLGVFGEWDVKKREPVTGKIIAVPPPAMPEITWGDKSDPVTIS